MNLFCSGTSLVEAKLESKPRDNRKQHQVNTLLSLSGNARTDAMLWKLALLMCEIAQSKQREQDAEESRNTTHPESEEVVNEDT